MEACSLQPALPLTTDIQLSPCPFFCRQLPSNCTNICGCAGPCEPLDCFERIQLASPTISTHSAWTHSGSGAATSNGTSMSRTSVSGRGSSTSSTSSGYERRPLPSRVAVAASAGRRAGGTTGGAAGATGSGRPSGAGVAGDGAGGEVKGEAGTAMSRKKERTTPLGGS